MSFWVLVQIFVNMVLFAGLAVTWVRLNRPAKDDPRLSRGLQLLQSKISVLEDLADRTEAQATQLTSLMEQKCKEIQNQVLQADRQIQRIEASMGKSLEVAKIFQDKIPHQEIIERQNTIKYVKAARLAHQGASVADIAAQVDLSHGEIEFISKVNREQLQFSVDDLPAWAQEGLVATLPNLDIIEQPIIAAQVAAKKETTQADALTQLGDQFRNALGAVPETPEPITPVKKQTLRKTKVKNEVDKDTVMKVVFPRIDINNNLG